MKFTKTLATIAFSLSLVGCAGVNKDCEFYWMDPAIGDGSPQWGCHSNK